MAQDTLTSAMVLQWMHRLSETYQQHKDELTALDAAIGDADHGANMARGFTAVAGKLDTVKDKDIGAIFKQVAMTLISTVGGASGPLYGTLFLQAAQGSNGKMALSHAELFDVLSTGLKGLMNRGKAAVGEKTMVDALVPAIEALKPVDSDTLSTAIDRAVVAVKQGADSTIPLVAKKGRASYLGDRSAGHLDPGCRSSCLLLEDLQQVIHSTVG